MENVKKPTKTSMLCIIDRETFHLFTKNMWIVNAGALCHITNNYTGFYIFTKINKFVQGSANNISATKKGKLHVNVGQVDCTEWLHILWPMKYYAKASVSLYSIACELLQGNTIKSDHKNNIVVQSSKGYIILYCHIKGHDNYVAEVEFLQETGHRRTQLANAFTKKNVNNLHAKLGYP